MFGKTQKEEQNSVSVELEHEFSEISGKIAGSSLGKGFLSTSGVLVSFFVMLIAFFSFFLVNQAVTAWETVSGMPQSVRYTWIFFALILVAAVLITLVQSVLIFFSLAQSPALSLQGLREIEERYQMKSEALNEQKKKSLLKLSQYLSSYQLDQKKCIELKSLGFTESDISELALIKKALLEPVNEGGEEHWTDCFRNRFQSVLDRGAEKRIREISGRVFVRTAVTPQGFIDSLIVGYAGLCMIRDLCLIYNVRMSTLSALIILGRVFFHACISAEIGKACDQVFEALFEGVSGTLGAVLSFASSKLAEGKANAIIAWRIGKATIALLQPLGK